MEPDTIFIYEKNEGALNFLRPFFRAEKGRKAVFFRDAAQLERKIKKTPPLLAILGAPACLEEAYPLCAGIPVIAMIGGNVREGLSSVIRLDIEFYMLAPFYREDLAHKLRVATSMSKGINSLAEKVQDLEAIIDIAGLMSTSMNPREVLVFIVKKVSEYVKVSRCSIISIADKDSACGHVVTSFEDAQIEDLKIDLQKYPEIKKALALKRPVYVEDALRDPLMKPVAQIIKPLGVKSILVVPMLYRDEVIGTLFLRTSGRTRFGQRELSFCSFVANMAVNSLYNAFLFEKLEKDRRKFQRLSITDYLTGSYNVRYLYLRLDEEFQRAKRYGAPLGCIMMDIDYFKRVNDKYGHKVGDMVLREFTNLVKRHIRRSDIFARYGGEEFVLLLPQTNLDGSRGEAERLRKLVRDNDFKSLREGDGLTMSLGISYYPDIRVEMPDDLITLADNALFEAKTTGRDKLFVS